MKNSLKYIFAIGLGASLFYWAFKGVDIASTLENFKNANYFLVFLAFILGLMAIVSRAYRWNLMLEPMGYQAKLVNTSAAVMIGYFTNLILPRAGELARSASLQKTENIPFEKSFGAVIAERIIDVFIALFLILVNILLEFGRLENLVSEQFSYKFQNVQSLAYWAILILIGLFLIFWVALRFKNRILKVAFVVKLVEIAKGLWSGLISVFKIKRPGLFIFHTIFIWTIYYVVTYLLCKAIPSGQDLSFVAVFTVLVMGSIGMAAPSIGGIGTYHILVGKIVTLYGLNAVDGVNLAFFLHSMNSILFLLIYGAMAFLTLLFNANKNKFVEQ